MKPSILKAISAALLVLSFALLFITCQENTKAPSPNTNASITPVPFPTNIVPGFKFPEDTATIINGWLGGYTAQYFDTVSIYKHAWGIWAGLTANSGQKWDGQDLLVYETWPGITDIQTMVREGKTDCPTRQGSPQLARPNQFDHARSVLVGGKQNGGTVDAHPNLMVTVSYDPTAACHATKYALLDSNMLKSKVNAGQISAIPAFPKTSITIKPTYFVGKVTDSLIVIPSWPGPPSPAQDFPDKLWGYSIYVDVRNGQPAGKKIVPAPRNPNPGQISAATCNLRDFIYFKLDKAAADYINQEDSSEGVNASAGDLALLVAMHVTSKEISNWTWQTFFWAADPDNPPFPSDAVAASLRPSQLLGAARHYALSTAYAMTRPNQPITGGTNTGVTPVIGYNPYLEPGLGQINGPAPKNFPNQLSPAMMWGVQSNCMSCHALAAYPSSFYTADQYISMNDPVFLGKVQLDFAWSIANNLTGKAAQPSTKN